MASNITRARRDTRTRPDTRAVTPAAWLRHEMGITFDSTGTPVVDAPAPATVTRTVLVPVAGPSTLVIERWSAPAPASNAPMPGGHATTFKGARKHQTTRMPWRGAGRAVPIALAHAPVLLYHPGGYFSLTLPGYASSLRATDPAYLEDWTPDPEQTTTFVTRPTTTAKPRRFGSVRPFARTRQR